AKVFPAQHQSDPQLREVAERHLRHHPTKPAGASKLKSPERRYFQTPPANRGSLRINADNHAPTTADPTPTALTTTRLTCAHTDQSQAELD
ncbi:hypothetical protein, partial [Mycobacterium sp. E2497]|uniref:hypothetical protein n=1 Tax=Mycobacterium sp. E2497 TaxID=1834135 RepID=UPI001E41AA2A